MKLILNIFLFVLFFSTSLSATIAEQPLYQELVSGLEVGLESGANIIFTVASLLAFIIAIGYLIWFARKGQFKGM